jgi:hypothetical protein
MPEWIRQFITSPKTKILKLINPRILRKVG